jgi:hypothetical protein
MLLAEGDDSNPSPTPTVSRAVLPKKGNFYLGIFDPYPASMGLGIVHYPGDFVGLYAGVGMGGAYAIGLRFRPVLRKLGPMVGVTWSVGEEIIGAKKGFLSIPTGLEWRWENGMYLGFGVHWGITPRLGKSEMKPYVQIGLAY